MASNLQLKPPDNFDFSKPDTWLKWKKRFEQFRVASGLKDESDPRQVGTLLYCMGEEAESILCSTDITADDKEKYDLVIVKFDAFFQVRKNVIFERAKFNRRVQLEGESAEQFITSLYALVETCEYGTLKDEMIRDRIVVGIRHNALSERLQGEAGLTLDKAKTMVRQKEAITEQNQQLRGDGTKQSPIVIEPVEGGRRRDPPSRVDKTLSDKPNSRGAAQLNLSVHGAVDQNTRRETGVLRGMLYATNAIERDTTATNASLRQSLLQPTN